MIEAKSSDLPPFDHEPRTYMGPDREAIIQLRQKYVNPAIFTLYEKPVMIVEGKMQYLFDDTGRRYLDGFAGIVTVSVGHCHPHVTKAAVEQLQTLAHTTTIYLHPNIALYAEMLASKFPGDLSVCYFVNSGSEATDLAILLARLYTGNYDVIALRNGYHGGNHTAMGLNSFRTWKHVVPTGFGVHHARAPYPYRGPFGLDDPEAGRKYATDVKETIDYATCGEVAAFIAESIQGVGAAVVYPDDYLRDAYQYIREAGGVCIADEVQSGFARTGSHFWGFETQGVIPDIVTMAKGIGNGAALAAVVTTSEIASALTNRIHFNTFGGNPVACAQGMAVLEVIEEENIQENAARIGARLFEGLGRLEKKHSIIGEVRGRGLMIGIELVRDRETKDPAGEECARVHERCKDLGLLLGKGGLHGNCLRIKPPMCLTEADADFIIDVLDAAFEEL